MSVAVTNSVSTIIIDDGNSQIAVSKELVSVRAQGNNVRVQWSPINFVEFPYTDFTAPTGASADAVADAIEAFLDSGITVTVTVAGQFAEDSAATSGETGLSVLAVRNDTIETALTSANGDYSWLTVDSAGRLGTRDNKAEDAAHVSGDIGSFILAVRNDTIAAAITSTDRDYSSIAVDSAGRVGTRDNKAAAASFLTTDIGAMILAVRNNFIEENFNYEVANGTYSQFAVDSAGRLGTRDNKAEDAVHTTGDVGSFILGVRNDANAALTSTDGDYSPVSVDSTGRLKVILAANSGVDIGDVDVLSVIPGTGATNLGKAEDAAHTTGDVGSFILGVRNDANAALSGTDLDYTPFAVDSAGRLKIAASELMLGLTGGNTVTVNGSITRPADTNAYVANDVITNSTTAPLIITFSGCSRLNSGSTGRTGVIQSATLIDSANETLKLDGDLFIFDTNVTMDNDNAAFTPTDAELATAVAIITFSGGTARSGTAGAGGNCAYPNAISGGIPFTCLTENQLFGIFVARNSYIPISAEIFTFRLGILRD